MATIIGGELSNWTEEFKAKRLHFVCVATGGLTACDFAASTIGGMNQEREVWPLTKKVNRMGETGTFWPRLALTVVPLPEWEGRSAAEDIDGFLRRCFEDVAKANRDYVKASSLYIDLNGWGSAYDFRRARRIAADVLGQEAGIATICFAPAAT